MHSVYIFLAPVAWLPSKTFREVYKSINNGTYSNKSIGRAFNSSIALQHWPYTSTVNTLMHLLHSIHTLYPQIDTTFTHSCLLKLKLMNWQNKELDKDFVFRWNREDGFISISFQSKVIMSLGTDLEIQLRCAGHFTRSDCRFAGLPVCQFASLPVRLSALLFMFILCLSIEWTWARNVNVKLIRFFI